MAAHANHMTDGTDTDSDGKVRRLRPISCQFNIVKQAASSWLFQLGQGTKVACAVYGPRSNVKDLNEFSEKCKVVCDVKLAPFANRGERRGRSGRSANEEEFSALLEQALIASVCLEKYPKSVLNVYVVILENDGNALGAAVTASSLSLAMAGVECYDLVFGASASIENVISQQTNQQAQQILIDPTAANEEKACGSIFVAYMPNLGKVNVLNVVGKINPDDTGNGLNACIESCKKIHTFARDILTKELVVNRKNV